MNKHIISFSGRKHSGKTLLSELCKEKYGYQVLYFADGLKNLICKLMDINRTVLDSMKDVSQEIILSHKINILEEELNLKSNEIEEFNRFENPFSSIREILQFLGTEIIRKYVPTWHIEQLKKNMTFNKICIGDCRFPDEKKFIEELGGETWIIIRPNYVDDVSNHSSETSLQWKMFGDNVIINNKDSEYLKNIWCDYMNTKKWIPSPFLKSDILDEISHESVISFLKISNKTNAKRMAVIIQNPLLLEDLKLLLL